MQEILEQLSGYLADPKLATSLSAQVRLCELMVQVQPFLQTRLPVWEDLVLKASSILSLTPERFVSICSIPSVQDKRRALQLPYRVSPPREDIYPKEGWLGAYLDTYARVSESEVPVAFHFWAALSVLSSALRRNVYMDRGAYYLYPNQYVVLVGPSGARKTGAYDRGLLVLRELNRLILHKWTGPNPPIITILPKKLTPEALMDALNDENPAAAFLGCDELSVLLGKNVHGSDRMVHLLTDGYGCQGVLESQTRTHGIRTLRNLYWCCVFGSTPEWLSEAITQDMISGGFTARCLFIYRGYSLTDEPHPFPTDPIACNTLAAMLAPWARAGLIEAKLTPDAKVWFSKWYAAVRAKVREGTVRPDLVSFYARKPDHLLKVAMGLTVSELCHLELDLTTSDEMRVDAGALRMADELLSYEETFMGDAFDKIGEHPDATNAHYLLQQIVKDPGIQHSVLYNRSRMRLGGLVNFKRLIEDLVEAEQVRKQVVPGRGKAVLYYWPVTPTD